MLERGPTAQSLRGDRCRDLLKRLYTVDKAYRLYTAHYVEFVIYEISLYPKCAHISNSTRKFPPTPGPPPSSIRGLKRALFFV